MQVTPSIPVIGLPKTLEAQQQNILTPLQKINFSAKCKMYRKEQLSYPVSLFLRIVSYALSFFNYQNKWICDRLSMHARAKTLQQICEKFIKKIKIDNLVLSQVENNLLQHVFSQQGVDEKAAIYAYKTCKYFKWKISIRKLQAELINKKPFDEQIAFKDLPHPLKRAIYSFISFNCGKTIVDESFARQQLQANPQLLLQLCNEEGKNFIDQMNAFLSDLQTYAKDLSLLSLYHQFAKTDFPILANGCLEAISEVGRTGSALEVTSVENIEKQAEERFLILNKTLESFLNDHEKLPLYDTSIERLQKEMQLQDISDQPLTIAMVGVEYASLMRQGGLAEAIEGLSRAFANHSALNKVRLIFPKYDKLPAEISQRLTLSETQFADGHGQPIIVEVAQLDNVECYFITHETFALGDQTSSIYGPTNKSCGERFAHFSGLAADLLRQMKGNDIIHLHDWHVAGVAIKLANAYEVEWKSGAIPPIVFTFHNNSRAAQGRNFFGAYSYDSTIQALQRNGITNENSNFFIETLKIADAVTTVSKNFAMEAQLPKTGEGISFAVRKVAKLGKLVGIVNGTSLSRWDPEHDTHLKEWSLDPASEQKIDLSYGQSSLNIYEQKERAKLQLALWIKRYLPAGRVFRANVSKPSLPKKEYNRHLLNNFKFDPTKPIVTYIGRLDSYQKGLDKLDEAIASTLKNGGQFIIIGSQEDQEATKILNQLEEKYTSGVLFVRDFKTKEGSYYYQDGALDRPGVSSLVRASSNFIYIPSRFEPCGLIQFEGWLFGSLAIASNTGGLADTVITRENSFEKYNGYLFDRDDRANNPSRAVEKALKEWSTLSVRNKNSCMQRLMSEGKCYGWATAPYGLSPLQKYCIVYQKAIKVAKMRAAINPLYHFNLKAYFYKGSIPSLALKAKGEALAEEHYLEAYYYSALNSQALSRIYLNLSEGTRFSVPAPYGRGVDFSLYQKLGAHFSEGQASFTVEAPNATSVALCLYDDKEHLSGEIPLKKIGTGQWVTENSMACTAGQRYRYRVNNQLKIDPYGLSHGQATSLIPYSIVCDPTSFHWKDQEWMIERLNHAGKAQPMSLYEVHVSSWLKQVNGGFLNYRELAHSLADYCQKANFTHVELMGILEHPSEESMGYQVTGFFAPNSRLGTVDDFKYFINYLHEKRIGVVLDWIPAHFATDEYGLKLFDGTPFFEPSKWKTFFSKRSLGYSWGTNFFDFSKKAVREFLISSAMYWVKEMHIDGLRVDAVRCILDSEDSTASKLFLSDLNAIIHKHSAGAITIAEDYSGSTKMTQQAYDLGFSFDLKWNISWMKQVLSYFSQPPDHRHSSYQKLIESIDGDKFDKMVLALSHDEVTAGMRTLINKGDRLTKEERYANLRAMLSFMMACPGKKLNFMGNELASETEWTEYLGTGESLRSQKAHLEEDGNKIFRMMRDLNALYKKQTALWVKDDNGWDLQWIERSHEEQKIVAYRRVDPNGKAVTCLHNFAGEDSFLYTVPLPTDQQSTQFQEIFSSDDRKYGGTGQLNQIIHIVSEQDKLTGYQVKIPACSTVMIEES